MKLHIISDLHQESKHYEPAPDVDADVVVIPGDIAHAWKGFDWLRATYPDKPVIVTLGNHDYFEASFPDLSNEFKAAARGSNIHVLENDAVEIGGVLFLGASLWTDFALEGDPEAAMARALDIMPDYFEGNIAFGPGKRTLRPGDTLARCRESVAWLRERFAAREGDPRPLVVVTHHAPSAKAAEARIDKPEYDPMMASRLDSLVESSGAKLWIHGHVHVRLDYMVGRTRVACNPRGDVARRAVEGFDPRFVVEI